MEQNNFNGQEQIQQNNTVHQPYQPSHEPVLTKHSAHEPEAQQIHINSVDKTSPMTQQSASSYNIHHSNPQYTSAVHNGTSYAHNPSSYENGNINGNSSLQNGNHTSHNKKSKSYGYFMLTALLVAIVITAIVIGVGWAVFYPRPTTAQQALVPPNTSTMITQDDIQDTDTDTDAESKDVVIIYGGNNNISDTTTKKSDATAKKSTSQTNRNDTALKSSPPPVQKTVKAPPAPVVTKTTTITSKKVSPPTPPPTTPVPSTPSEYTTKYWIQVFSTNNRDKAVQIKKTLDEQGIKSTVITKTINSKIYYRLRIGPYYNKSEGHKFLEWVKRNEKYKDAYISVDRS